MIRWAIGLMLPALLLATLSVADEPDADKPEEPVRLKKKQRPGEAARPPAADQKKEPMAEQKEPKKEDKAKPDDAPAGEPLPDIDEQELLARVGRNMRASESRLADREVGEGTRQLQRDIVDDLDKLIALGEQPPDQDQNQDQQGGQEGQQQQGKQQAGKQQQGQMKSGGKQQQGKGTRTARSSRQRRGQQMAKGGQTGQDKDGQQTAKNEPGQGNQPGAGNSKEEGEMNKLADLYKDVWGHLPESMRSEMDVYAREKFMPKYNELIKQYYATISEKGRRKGE